MVKSKIRVLGGREVLWLTNLGKEHTLQTGEEEEAVTAPQRGAAVC